jgi:uncharacterized membrane protein
MLRNGMTSLTASRKQHTSEVFKDYLVIILKLTVKTINISLQVSYKCLLIITLQVFKRLKSSLNLKLHKIIEKRIEDKLNLTFIIINF